MRAFKRVKDRGFTLVELMIVVAIIGVLAALAIFGVRRYLAAAKSAEAKNAIGAMNRGSIGAYERENMPSELVTPGQSGLGSSHALCGSSAAAVPAGFASIQNKKYLPDTAAGKDYNAGGQTVGWPCIKFSISEPQYYQYQYTLGVNPLTPNANPQAPATGWGAAATGDLDGNNIHSEFQLVGDIKAGTPIAGTSISEYLPDELPVRLSQNPLRWV